ncbi:LVIVD repeat-containing protein [Actinoallomurus acaciae]|uniref:LVIVD repeat-containing protein n=1 Tax=Actinoallomurus acaciae TaxID=502577 RepID=A0ABV5YIS0_9ACTN
MTIQPVRRRGRPMAAVVVIAVSLLLLPAQASSADTAPDSGIAPAVCGPGSSPEDGVQGRIPLADRKSGRSAQGYHCNLTLAGQYQGQGAGFINATYHNCVYFGSFLPASELTTHPGVQVIDATDPARPRFVESLNSPAFASGTWESLKVDPVHGYLAATGVQAPPGAGGLLFDLYSIKDDCAHPKPLNGLGHSGLPVPTAVLGHEGGFAPDGNTYYATDGIGDVTAIDVSAPATPKVIDVSPVGLTNHGFSISPDGRTMYATTIAPAGVQVLDIGDVQDRRPLPQIRQIGQLTWPDGLFSQHTINFTDQGHRYLFAVDEAGTGGVRLINIDDPAEPVLVREYRLQIDQPSEKATREADEGGDGIFGYDAHYCTVDRPVDPTRLACSYWQSGIRLYDIRDLQDPRELGYYDPKAQTGLVNRLALANSPHTYFVYSPDALDPGDLRLGTLFGSLHPDMTTDWCSSPAAFNGPDQLWVTCQDNGFLALNYTASS